MGRPRKAEIKQDLLSTLKAPRRPRVNPKLTSMGIYSTSIGINKPNSMEAIIRKVVEQMQQQQQGQLQQPIQEAPDAPETKSDIPPTREEGEEKEDVGTTTEQPKQSYMDTILSGRRNFPPSARAVLKQYGDQTIKSLVVIRQPIMSITPKIFNLVSFGKFQESIDKQPYDTLFHLRCVATLESGTKIQIEKSHVINISTTITKVKGQEEMKVDIPATLTLSSFVEGSKKILGDKTYSYDGFTNNCQDFQLALFKGSNILTPQLENFIKQDVSEIADRSPVLSKLANMITGIGGKFDELIHGAGINKKYKKSHLVQSVLFNKKQWTIPEAVEWLNDAGYIAPKVDTTSHFHRFRQLDPSKYPKSKWSYTTHRLGHGIDFVILYTKSDKEMPIAYPKGMTKTEIHKIMSGDGVAIHIDLGSHNATGKAKNKTTGDGIKGGALTDAQLGQIIDLGLPEADLNRIITGEFEPAPRARQPRARQPNINIINPQPQQKPTTDDYMKQLLQLKLVKQLTKPKTIIKKVVVKRKYKKKTEAEKIKALKEKLKKAQAKAKGGALIHDPPNPLSLKNWNNIVGGIPHQEYRPLDMKLTSQNVMLDNLKKSDLEDLARLQSEVKRGVYDREAAIRKIRGITKGRVKAQVKKTKSMKPRNLKTRGSLEAKKERLKKYQR